jgi:hypothetical protein
MRKRFFEPKVIGCVFQAFTSLVDSNDTAFELISNVQNAAHGALAALMLVAGRNSDIISVLPGACACFTSIWRKSDFHRRYEVHEVIRQLGIILSTNSDQPDIPLLAAVCRAITNLATNNVSVQSMCCTESIVQFIVRMIIRSGTSMCNYSPYYTNDIFMTIQTLLELESNQEQFYEYYGPGCLLAWLQCDANLREPTIVDPELPARPTQETQDTSPAAIILARLAEKPKYAEYVAYPHSIRLLVFALRTYTHNVVMCEAVCKAFYNFATFPSVTGVADVLRAKGAVGALMLVLEQHPTEHALQTLVGEALFHLDPPAEVASATDVPTNS